jgi:glycosyltransferase involved in cell wall biosynthesis
VKVYFNRQIRRSPYGGGAHFLSGYADYLTSHGHQVCDNLENGIDIIYMLDPRPEDVAHPGYDALFYYKHYNKNVKIIHRVNDTDKARGTSGVLEPLMIEANKIADATVFISDWVKEHYENLGYKRLNRKEVVIVNGCNEAWFFPKKRVALGDTIKLVTHHWSDNSNKGADVYEYIDKVLVPRSLGRFSFTYVGRYCKGYKPINTHVVPPKYGLELGNELREHDIYVTGARWEACGMHHIEGAACGLPVLAHRDGGGVVELVDPAAVFDDDFDISLVNKLESVVSSYINLSVKQRTLTQCCEQYLKFTESVM